MLRFLLCWDNKLCHNSNFENTLLVYLVFKIHYSSLFRMACVTLSKHGRDCVQTLVVKEQWTRVLALGGQ
jgi:hypothetical protein